LVEHAASAGIGDEAGRLFILLVLLRTETEIDRRRLEIAEQGA